jgi:hypothetical protein
MTDESTGESSPFAAGAGMMACMGVRPLVMVAAVSALAVTGCGSEGAYTQVSQPATAPTSAPSGGGTQTGGTRTFVITNLPARYERTLAPLMDAQTRLIRDAAAVTSAAKNAQALADRVAAGYNAPTGAVPEVVRLRDAVKAFGSALHTFVSANSLLPRLSVKLQARAAELAKRRPQAAAPLLAARQRVDGAGAQARLLERDLASAESRVRDQQSKVTLDHRKLNSAATTADQSSSDALSRLNSAVEAGIQALVAAS